MTYLGSGDPARRRNDYYPEWLDNLADGVTLEGSVLDGTVHGAVAVRTLLGHARTLYEYQEFSFAGPYGDNPPAQGPVGVPGAAKLAVDVAHFGLAGHSGCAYT